MLVLVGLWSRPAAAASIRTKAWEIPYASGVALKEQKAKEKLPRQSQALYASQRPLLVAFAFALFSGSLLI